MTPIASVAMLYPSQPPMAQPRLFTQPPRAHLGCGFAYTGDRACVSARRVQHAQRVGARAGTHVET